MTTTHPRSVSRRPRKNDGRLDLVNLAVLFTSAVAIALVLVGVARSGSDPVFVTFPMLLGIWAILNLRR